MSPFLRRVTRVVAATTAVVVLASCGGSGADPGAGSEAATATTFVPRLGADDIDVGALDGVRIDVRRDPG